jgi:hypothetical protein
MQLVFISVASADVIGTLSPLSIRRRSMMWFLQNVFHFQSATNLNFRSSKFKNSNSILALSDFRFNILYERLSVLFKRAPYHV